MTAMAAVTLNMRMYLFYALCVRFTVSGLDVEGVGPVDKAGCRAFVSQRMGSC